MHYLKTTISLFILRLLAVSASDPDTDTVDSSYGNRGEDYSDSPSPQIRGLTPLLPRNTFPYPSHEDCLKNIGTVAKDKSTFYSGLGYYPKEKGYVYLDDFIKARDLLKVDSVYPPDYCTSDPELKGGKAAYRSFADSFSGIFAEKSSGTAYLLTPSQCDPSPKSIWKEVEYKKLIAAGVKEIIRVDPEATTISTTIYPKPTHTKLPKLKICPTDPPLPSGGATTTKAS